MIDGNVLLSDWQEDAQAAARRDRTLAIRVSAALGAAGIAGAFVCAGLLERFPQLGILLGVLAVVGVAGIAYAGYSSRAMQTAAASCSRCKQPMKEAVSPCIDSFIPGRIRKGATRRESGNLYFVEHGGATGAPEDIVFEVRTRWRVCDACKHYVILEKSDLLRIGTGEEAIEGRERQLKTIREAIGRLSGKKTARRDPAEA